MRISAQDPVAASQVGAALPGSARAAGHRGHVRGSGVGYPRALCAVDLARPPPGLQPRQGSEDLVRCRMVKVVLLLHSAWRYEGQQNYCELVQVWRDQRPGEPRHPRPRARGRGRLPVPGWQPLRGLHLHHHGEQLGGYQLRCLLSTSRQVINICSTKSWNALKFQPACFSYKI